MNNSVLTHIQQRPDEEHPVPEIGSESGFRTSQWQHEDSQPLTFRYTFESKDQAVAVGRILRHQSATLRAQAEKNTGDDASSVPYISDMLVDYANILDSLLDEIKKTSDL